MRTRRVATKLGFCLYPAENEVLSLSPSVVQGSLMNGSKYDSKPWKVKFQTVPSREDSTLLFFARPSSSQASRLLSSLATPVDRSRAACNIVENRSLLKGSLAGFESRRSFQIFSYSPVGASSELTQDIVDIDVSNQSTNLLSNTFVREGVTLALKDYLINVNGASHEDAEFVSRNCPTFLKKLVESVTKTSVVEEVDSKRLHGCVLSFLEKEERDAAEDSTTVLSLGYVSTGRLSLGDMMMLLKFPLALTKHGGFLKSMEILDSLGWSRLKLREMLERNPELSAWTAEEFQTNICVLENLGVNRKDMLSFIENPSLFRDMGQRLNPLLMYLDTIGIHRNVVGDLMKFNPLGLINMPLANFKERVDFLLELGLSSAEVEKSMRSFPQLVHLRLANLTQKIEYFEGIGVDKDSMVKIVAKLPSIFRHSTEKNLVPKVKMLESLGIGRDFLSKFIEQYPQFFGCSIENFQQKITFFQTNGLTGQRLVKMFTWHPRVFSFSVNANLSKKLQFLVDKGFTIRSKAMGRALVSCITISKDSLEARFQNLCTLGFTHNEVCELVRKQPTIFCLSEKTIRLKMDYLLKTMNRAPSELLKCPGYLLYSLEVRIKPRQRVVDLLASKGKLREDGYSLSTILQRSEKDFIERFVKLDPECVAVYEENV